MNLSKDDKLRLGTMQWALKIAKEQGVEALEKEVALRCRFNVPWGVSQAHLDKFTQNVKENMYNTMKIVVGTVLHDKLGFGQKRLDSFWTEFENICECVFKDYVTFEDLRQCLNEEAKQTLDQRRDQLKTVRLDRPAEDQ